MNAFCLITVLAVGQADPAADAVAPVEPRLEPTPPALWLDVDFLYGWLRGARDPLSPGDRRGCYPRPGLGVGVGAWLDADHTCGISARGFGFLPNETTSVLALPGGMVGIEARDGEFCGADVGLLKSICGGDGCRLVASLGYRYLQFRDSLALAGSGAVGPVGFLIHDRFEASNTFNGVDLGLSARGEWEGWTYEAFGRVAGGNGRRAFRIEGSTVAAVPGQSLSGRPGGLLTAPSNIGRQEHEDFTLVSEVGVGVGYQFSACFRARAGYSFLHWADIARGGDQVDPVLIAPRPAFPDRTDDLWLHTLSLGVELRF